MNPTKTQNLLSNFFSSFSSPHRDPIFAFFASRLHHLQPLAHPSTPSLLATTPGYPSPLPPLMIGPLLKAQLVAALSKKVRTREQRVLSASSCSLPTSHSCSSPNSLSKASNRFMAPSQHYKRRPTAPWNKLYEMETDKTLHHRFAIINPMHHQHQRGRPRTDPAQLLHLLLHHHQHRRVARKTRSC